MAVTRVQFRLALWSRYVVAYVRHVSRESGFALTWSNLNSVAPADESVCWARAAIAFSTTGSPSGAEEAIILPVWSRIKARPSVPTAWFRSRDVRVP